MKYISECESSSEGRVEFWYKSSNMKQNETIIKKEGAKTL